MFKGKLLLTKQSIFFLILLIILLIPNFFVLSYFQDIKGNTSMFIADTANGPAKIIKEFRKKGEKPLFKGAYINQEIYIGDNLLDSLVAIKSKEEVIGEIIGLLQSPAQRVIAALQNQPNKEEGAE